LAAQLRAELAAHPPDAAIVVLGTNDEYLGPGAAKRQAPYVDAIMAEMPARRVLVGPPTLPKNNGVTAMLAARVSPYFASNRLTIPRARDNVHPTSAGAAGWANAVWAWATGQPQMLAGR
jgi:lysophospholipase L1-like esterase